MVHTQEKLIELYIEWRSVTFPEWARARDIPMRGLTTQDPATRLERANEGKELLKQLKTYLRPGKTDDSDIDVRLCHDDCKSAIASLTSETLSIREVIDTLAPNPEEKPWIENERLSDAAAMFPRAVARAQASGPWLKQTLILISKDLQDLENSSDQARRYAAMAARIECEHLANNVGVRPLINDIDENEEAGKMWTRATEMVRRDRIRLDAALSNIMPSVLPEHALNRLTEEIEDRGRTLGLMESWTTLLRERVEKTGWAVVPSHAPTGHRISLPGRTFSGAQMYSTDPMKSSTVFMAMPCNPLTLPLTMAHETYPGHLLQRIHQARCKSTAQKLLGNSLSSEGWAHYAEMKLHELQIADPRELEVGLAQRSLLRSARLLARSGVANKRLNLQEAYKIFNETARLDPKTAMREAQRCQWDPKVATYSIGRHALDTMEKEFVDRGMGDAAAFRNQALPLMCAPLDIIAKRMGLKRPPNV